MRARLAMAAEVKALPAAAAAAAAAAEAAEAAEAAASASASEGPAAAAAAEGPAEVSVSGAKVQVRKQKGAEAVMRTAGLPRLSPLGLLSAAAAAHCPLCRRPRRISTQTLTPRGGSSPYALCCEGSLEWSTLPSASEVSLSFWACVELS